VVGKEPLEETKDGLYSEYERNNNMRFNIRKLSIWQ
jgi:hypothetical protein